MHLKISVARKVHTSTIRHEFRQLSGKKKLQIYSKIYRTFKKYQPYEKFKFRQLVMKNQKFC